MKKIAFVLLAVLALAGCTDSAKPLHFAALPAEFADCKIVYLTNTDGRSITLARCPNSTTTVSETIQQGKSSVVRTSVTVSQGE